MIYTLREFSPIAFTIRIRCSQYSTGILEQWISPAQIFTSLSTRQAEVSMKGLNGCVFSDQWTKLAMLMTIKTSIEDWQAEGESLGLDFWGGVDCSVLVSSFSFILVCNLKLFYQFFSFYQLFCNKFDLSSSPSISDILQHNNYIYHHKLMLSLQHRTKTEENPLSKPSIGLRKSYCLYSNRLMTQPDEQEDIVLSLQSPMNDNSSYYGEKNKKNKNHFLNEAGTTYEKKHFHQVKVKNLQTINEEKQKAHKAQQFVARLKHEKEVFQGSIFLKKKKMQEQRRNQIKTLESQQEEQRIVLKQRRKIQAQRNIENFRQRIAKRRQITEKSEEKKPSYQSRQRKTKISGRKLLTKENLNSSLSSALKKIHRIALGNQYMEKSKLQTRAYTQAAEYGLDEEEEKEMERIRKKIDKLSHSVFK